jgi:uncharacterized protein YndB with AHSA1/START domain
MSPDFTVSQVFACSQARMFELWTRPELLQQWFGPAGVTVPECHMDLRPGGRFHFCMQGPDGSRIWGLWAFLEIEAPRKLVWLHSFADAQGQPARHPMSPTWPLLLHSTVTFEEESPGQTRVGVRWAAHQAEPLEQATFDAGHASMHMGWSGTLAQLQAFIAKHPA